MRLSANSSRRSRPAQRLLPLIVSAIAAVAGLLVLACRGSDGTPTAVAPPSAPPSVASRGPGTPVGTGPAVGPHGEPMVFTYLFYWYDAQTGAHLRPDDPLPTRPVDSPPTSWRSVDWFRKELTDMAYAGIDVVLPVYWGTTEEWSTAGLPVLAEAKQQLEAEGQGAPDIGLFYDTASLQVKDLTSPAGKDYFYTQVKEFYRRIPPDQWARVDGRPVIWLFLADPVDAFDQSTFEHLYNSFERDFGARPYIVRELSWDYPISGGQGKSRKRDLSQPITTDASYAWGRAQNGYNEIGTVAGVGPGYDERQIKGRSKVYRPRDEGRWYTENFRKAIASGKRMLVIETWNELHEASGIGETREFGRQYIELTRSLVQEYKRALTSN
jgi:hypothetical protein